MPDPSLAEIIRRQGRERPEATAFITPERTWTFGEVDTESSRVAAGLASLGIGPGDRVACLTKQMAECGILLLGAAKLGAVCMPVNWRLAPSEIEYIIDHGQAKFMLADESFLASLARTDLPGLHETVVTERGRGRLLHTFDEWRAGFPANDPGHRAASMDTAIQLYSSGTTGLPKGVEISNRGYFEVLDIGPQMIGLEPARSVMLNVLPTFHIAGMGNLMMPLLAGCPSVFLPDFDPAKVIAAIGEHRVTHGFFVPAMVLFLLQSPAAAAGDFSSLQMISYGGSPISETVLTQAKRVFGCGLLQAYGMTEAPFLAHLLPEDHDPDGPRAHLLRSAGTPVPGVELRIVDAQGREVPEGAGGEVWVRTRQNMKGYWRNRAATEETFPCGREDGVGWMRTGDAGYLREGYLFIQDRIKDLIISGGENIYPAEVENVLSRHPAVSECAIIGVPDDRWGEAVKACVVLRAGRQVSEADLIEFMRANVAHYKCPKSVDFFDVLPRNPSGKLLKRVLREPYWSGRDRAVS